MSIAADEVFVKLTVLIIKQLPVNLISSYFSNIVTENDR